MKKHKLNWVAILAIIIIFIAGGVLPLLPKSWISFLPSWVYSISSICALIVIVIAIIPIRDRNNRKDKCNKDERP